MAASTVAVAIGLEMTVYLCSCTLCWVLYALKCDSSSDSASTDRDMLSDMLFRVN